MRIDELRSTLDDQGAAVEDTGATDRLQAVHGRIRTARRRRMAAAAGGTAAAAAAVALAVVPGLDNAPAPAPGPADEPTVSATDYTKGGVTFRGEVLGERLLGAAIGDPGQSTVSFDFVVGEEGLRFSPMCHGPSPDLMVIYSVAGHPAGAVGCGENPDPDPGARGSTYEAPPEKVLLGWGLEPGDTATMSVRLVAAEDSDGPTVEDPQAVIGAGVYEDTRATRVVAGVEVPQRVEHDGRSWELVGTSESDPGSDSLWTGSEGDVGDGPQLILVATSGFRGASAYDIRLDGEVFEGMSQARGVNGPSWQKVEVFAPGRAYELELVVEEGSSRRTRLAFLAYETLD